MKNKRTPRLIALALFLVPGITGLAQPQMAPREQRSSLALVELFTSEGCSSCPPADEVVAHIAKLYPANVLVLSFHVDYWDRLGWKDAFSSAEYTRRQKQYAEVMGLPSIYTPQVILNGDKEFLGSDEAKLKEAINTGSANPAPLSFEANAKNMDDKTITVTWQRTGKDKNELHIALVQIHAETAVKKGENAGRQLQHINIVRALADAKKTNGTSSLNIPAGLSAKDCRVIAFTQDPGTLHITAATEIPIR